VGIDAGAEYHGSPKKDGSGLQTMPLRLGLYFFRMFHTPCKTCCMVLVGVGGGAVKCMVNKAGVETNNSRCYL